MLDLPPHVHVVHAKGRDYHYFQPNRGTAYQGERVALGTDPTDPEFWKAVKRLTGEQTTGIKSGSFAALIQAYKNSADWADHTENTRENYSISLARIEAAWGEYPVGGLTAIGIYALRDKLAHTPVAANSLVSVLRTLLAWGLPRGYGERNPAIEVVAINIQDEKNAKPWPELAYTLLLEHGPPHLRMAGILGRITGQRRSDLVMMGQKNRRDDGLALTIKKLRGKAHFIPLNADEILEIDSWPCSDTGPWIISPRGHPMSGDHLGSSLGRWVASRPELKDIEQLTPHGWRAMAVCDRRIAGLEHQEIAAQLCMSLPMVMRYSKHIDQERLARRGNEKRQAVIIPMAKAK